MEIERQQLPNSTLILIFGILSIIGCCCYGLVGLIFGVITLVLAKKASDTYAENPEMYNGYQNVKSGKILAIIGVSLSVIYIVILIVGLIMYGGIEGIQELQKEMMEQYGG
ncbi:CCC motif membrane protein [Gillisia sp. Q332]|uniref:CCC motif membrane protein n=1 Tax=Gillisia xinjiangensis TaxID=3384765 RepID=UPI00391BC112